MTDQFSWETPFKAEDFKRHTTTLYPDSGCAEYIADEANARFREIVEKHGKRVYGTYYKWSEDGIEWRYDDSDEPDEHTHTGVIICEKELTK